MPPLKNPKHERFAQERAKGKSAAKAYELAGYNPNRHNAVRLTKMENIINRIAEIAGNIAKNVELSRADILRMLIEDRKLARDNGQSRAAMKADELLGRELHHMFTERRELTIRKLSEMTEAELDAALSEFDPGEAGEASNGVTH